MCTEVEQLGSAREALAAVRAGLRYLTNIDAAELTTTEQADCLRGLAAAESMQLAAKASMIAAFNASDGYADDGQLTVKSWLRWQTRVTSAAARAATAWSRRLATHPDVAAALAEGGISPSYAREFCDWTDRMPADCRRDADRILLDAAAGGAELADLSGLAEEIFRRCAPPDTDDGSDRFDERWLRLTQHYRGHARLDGELTPRAAAALRAELDALGKKRGPEDDRTTAQREHDALEEACVRIVGGGLPDRAGQQTQIQLAVPLQQLDRAPAARPAGRGVRREYGAHGDRPRRRRRARAARRAASGRPRRSRDGGARSTPAHDRRGRTAAVRAARPRVLLAHEPAIRASRVGQPAT